MRALKTWRVDCEHHDEIDQAISTWTKQYSESRSRSALAAAGISAERVRRINEVVDGADWRDGIFPDGRTARRFDAERRNCHFLCPPSIFPPPASAPSLGEHSGEVLRAWLNCSDAEIDEL